MGKFKTPKGTELPLMELQGKPYLQVAHRLVWFREELPDASIETSFELDLNIAKAVVRNEAGRIIATAHKSITSGKKFPLESAETGAIGRALAMCGFGTQFAGDELDEGEEIADAPIAAARRPSSAARDTLNPSAKQIARMWAIAKQTGWTPEDVKEYFSKLGVEHSSKMTIPQYNHFCKLMEEFPKDKGFDTSLDPVKRLAEDIGADIVRHVEPL